MSKRFNTEETVTLSKADFKLLQSMYPDMHGIIQNMEGVVHPSLMARLKAVSDKMEKVFRPFFEKEENAYEENYVALEKVAQENNLEFTWSVTEVPATDLNKVMGTVKEIIYESWGPTQKHTFPGNGKKITWLEAWKIAENLMRASGDNHHVFIEAFSEDKKNKGVYHLSCGS